MDILDLLASDNYIPYNKTLAKQIGLENTIVFGALCGYQRCFKNQEFYREQQIIMEDTCLTEYAVRKSIKELQALGFISVTKKGLPAKFYYTININKFLEYVTSSGIENSTTGDNDNNTSNKNNIIKYYNKEIPKEISSTGVDTQEPKQVDIVSIDSANNTLDTTDKPIFNKDEYILELFNKIWEKYPRKVNKQLAKKTWTKKFKGLKTQEEILEKARKIGTLFVQNQKQWVEEGRKIQFVPHCSSWLSANVPDKE